MLTEFRSEVSQLLKGICLLLLYSCNQHSEQTTTNLRGDSGISKQQRVSNPQTQKNLVRSFFNNIQDRYFSTAFTAFTYTKDGQKIIAGDKKGNIVIWLASDLSPIDTIVNAHPGSIKQIFIDPLHDTYFVSFDGSSIKIWDIFNDNSFVHEIPLSGKFIALNEKGILAVGNNCEIDLYHFTNGLFSEDSNYIGSAINQYLSFSSVTAISISSNSKLMAAYSKCFGLRIWNLEGIDSFPALKHYVLNDGYDRWKGENMNSVIYEDVENVNISSLAFSRDSRFLASVDVQNKQVIVYSTKDWTKFSVFKLKKGELRNETSLDFSQDGKFLMLTGLDKVGVIFDLEEQHEFNEFKCDFEFIDAKFNNNDKEFTSIDKAGKIRIWTTNSSLVSPRSESLTLSGAKLSLTFEPVFLPCNFSINSDLEFDVIPKKNYSFVTFLGKCELSSNINVNEVLRKKGEDLTNKDLLIIFINRRSNTKSEYLIKGGNGLTAEANGKILFTAENGKITIDITDAVHEVRLRNVY